MSKELYQVVVTDDNGLVSGAVFQQPLSAIFLFAMYSSREGVTEVTFRKIGDSAAVLADNSLEYAILFERPSGTAVTFSNRSSKNELVEFVLTIAKSPEAPSLKCTKITLINLKTAKVAFVYSTADTESSVETPEDIIDSKSTILN